MCCLSSPCGFWRTTCVRHFAAGATSQFILQISSLESFEPERSVSVEMSEIYWINKDAWLCVCAVGLVQYLTTGWSRLQDPNSHELKLPPRRL